MFTHRIAVGHAGDVVGNLASLASCQIVLALVAALLDLIVGRQQVGLGKERLKEFGDDALSLAGHAVDLIVTV